MLPSDTANIFAVYPIYFFQQLSMISSDIFLHVLRDPTCELNYSASNATAHIISNISLIDIRANFPYRIERDTAKYLFNTYINVHHHELYQNWTKNHFFPSIYI